MGVDDGFRNHEDEYGCVGGGVVVDVDGHDGDSDDDGLGHRQSCLAISKMDTKKTISTNISCHNLYDHKHENATQTNTRASHCVASFRPPQGGRKAGRRVCGDLACERGRGARASAAGAGVGRGRHAGVRRPRVQQPHAEKNRGQHRQM